MKNKMRLFSTLIATLMSFGLVAAQLPVSSGNSVLKNLLINPGFENGTYGWTASGGATKTVNTTAKGFDNYGYDWDSNSASQTLDSAAITIPAGYLGRSGLVYCNIKTPSGSATHTLTVYDGSSNVVTPASVTSSTSFARTAVSFTFPSSGSVRLRLTSVASNEPEIYIDDCFLGLADGQFATLTGTETLTHKTIQFPTTGGTATSLNYYEEGSFSINYNGGVNATGSPANTTKTVKFVRIGSVVTLDFSDNTSNITTGSATSNLIISTGAELPSRLRPLTNNRNYATAVVSGGTTSNTMGRIVVQTDGNIAIVATESGGANWSTATANCGIQQTSVTYTLQ